MNVFPANDEAYRKRKRAHRACEQCKRRRRRCDFPLGSTRCQPCQDADIACSLAPEHVEEKKDRLDVFARQTIVPDIAVTSVMSANSINTKQPSLVPLASPGPKNGTPLLTVQGRTQAPTRQRPKLGPRSNSAGITQTLSGRASSDVPSLFARPTLGKRSSSYHATPQDKVPQSPIKEEALAPNTRRAVVSPTLTPPVPTSPSSSYFTRSPSSTNSSDGAKNASPLTSATAKLSLASGSAGAGQENIGVWVRDVSVQKPLNSYLHTYLSSINAFSMPLRQNREELINLYLKSVHQMLPVIDADQFLQQHSVGQAPTLLLHAVLLCAARHKDAAKFLGVKETVRQFCASTAEKIRALLFAEIEQDRLTLVRVYALLSLHSEGPDGLENSCMDLNKAIHYAISLGLHHERDFVDKEVLKRLWWSLWCLDRISSCVNARPIIIHNGDMSIRPIKRDEHALLYELVQSCLRLEKVIHLYRPISVLLNSDSGGDKVDLSKNADPRSLEDVRAASSESSPLMFNAVFALLHNVMIILAQKRAFYIRWSKSKRAAPSEAELAKDNEDEDEEDGMPPAAGLGTMYTPWSFGNQQQAGHLYNSGVRERRRAAAAAAAAAAPSSSGTSSPDDLEQGRAAAGKRMLDAAGALLRIVRNVKDLPPLPLVPYCVSLTLAVFLRTYPEGDKTSGLGWKDACMTLDVLGGRWWVAGAMGSMGWNVFKNIEREEEEKYRAGLQQQQQQQQSTWQEPEVQITPPVFTDAEMSDIPLTLEQNLSIEDQYLRMFSDLPNQTSFLDQAMTLESFSEMEQWLEEKTR